MELRDFGPAASVDHVRVQRIGRYISIFNNTDRMPIAKCNLSIVAATGDADRATLLLSSANPIREGIGDCNVIELRRRLVIPGTPRGPAVHRYQSSLIADQNNDVGIIGVDPQVLIVVTARCAAEAAPGLAGIRGLHGHGARAVNDVGILRVHLRSREIATADAPCGTGIVGHARPALAGIVGAVNPKSATAGGYGCVQATRIAGSDGYIDLREITRQAVGESMPGIPSVRRFEKATCGSIEQVVVFPRTLARFPQ